jgi:hypothetical protein
MAGINFLLQKIFSVVSYMKKGDRQMQAKAQHCHRSVYSILSGHSCTEPLFGSLKTNGRGSPTVSGHFLHYDELRDIEQSPMDG